MNSAKYQKQTPFKWKLTAIAMILLLLSVNVITLLPIDNNLTSIEQVEECNDSIEEDACIVLTESVFLVASVSSKVRYGNRENKIYYSDPYYRIVYPPPDNLIKS